MALINSLNDTNLKSLKYSGRQPLVTKDINNPRVYNSFSHGIDARGDDVLRLSKLMFTSAGVNFLANTAGTNLIDPGRSTAPPQRERLGSSKSFTQVLSTLGAMLRPVIDTALDTAAVTASTIAQVGVSGTGTHLVLGFKGKRGYLRRTQGHVLSQKGKIVPIPNDFISELESGDSSTYDQLNLKYGGNKHSAKDFSYDSLRNDREDGAGKVLGDIASAIGVDIGDTGKRSLRDFTTKTHMPINPDITKEKRTGLGNSGGRKLVRYTGNYQAADFTPAEDKINILPPVRKGQLEADGGITHTTDMIKFNFEVLDPDEGNDNLLLFFRAYLDSFSDTYTGTWNPHQYLGRAEDFYTYGGFGRAISFGFKAAASTRQELKPIYTKLAVLASTTAPSYHTEQSFMRGTLTNVTVGDYLVNQPGFLTSVGYTWQQGYPWEIAMGVTYSADEEGSLVTGKENIQQLPHILDCSISFQPIHRFAPKAGSYHYFTNPDENRFFSEGQIRFGSDEVKAVNAISKGGKGIDTGDAGKITTGN